MLCGASSDRQRLGERRHRRAQRVRQHEPFDRLLHRNRRDVDDAAAAARLHVRNRAAAQPDDAEEQRVDGVDPRALVQRHERAGRRAAGVGDEDVEAAEASRRSSRSTRVTSSARRRSAWIAQHLAAGRLDRGGGRGQRRRRRARRSRRARRRAPAPRRTPARGPCWRRRRERPAAPDSASSRLGWPLELRYFLWKYASV